MYNENYQTLTWGLKCEVEGQTQICVTYFNSIETIMFVEVTNLTTNFVLIDFPSQSTCLT